MARGSWTAAAIGFGLLMLASPTKAQGTFSTWATGGLAQVQMGDGLQAPANNFAYGGGFGLTFGAGDKRSALLFGFALHYLERKAEPIAPMSDQFGLSDFGGAFSAGWRVGNTGFGAVLEARRMSSSPAAGDEAYSPGFAQLILYGAYLSVGLGSPGSTAGRFRIEARYLWGSGDQDDISSTYFGIPANSGLQSVPVKSERDLRLRLGFSPTPTILLRLEYQDETMDLDDFSVQGYPFQVPDLLDRHNRSLFLSIGFVITMGS